VLHRSIPCATIGKIPSAIPGSRLQARPPLVILFLALLAPAAIHMPQPLLPSLSLLFLRDLADVALFMTLVLAPLGIMPVVYGYLLEGFSTRSLLIVSTLVMAVSGLWLWAQPDYGNWTLARALQGLALPALMTAVMTMLSVSVPREARAHTMGLYVAATIVGGYSGRLLAGWLSDNRDLTTPFLILAICFLVAIPGLLLLKKDSGAGFAKIRLPVALSILRLPRFAAAYIMIFAVFFVFTGVLTLLPFELRNRDSNITDFQLGLLYSGYLTGLLVSLNIRRLRERFVITTRLVMIGLATFGFGTLLLLLHGYLASFLALFLFCGGMFLVHTTLSGLLNHSLDRHHGVINGLYLASYYLGGALGSQLPGYLYGVYGWESVILLCLSLLLFCLWLLPVVAKEPVTEIAPQTK
jgi:YNFM family putative membrane transporter